ncbi:6-phosphofructokinase [Sphingobacteriales bacterium UPWRP_1]|nr:6-phosphofructokinase [Sphingobacteriales bacterium TSM_CSM]PSJ72004.1 6-phosphofructokinase [Sphingobacteriales bacterium UPWRP_1]
MQNGTKKIGLLTSGGDAPGMNACIRAVVRTAEYYGHKVFGFYRGYAGLIENEMDALTSRSVSNIIQRGGTILQTARSKEFMTPKGMEEAYENLKAERIDSLIVIGGDGSFKGALEFNKRYPQISVIGIPGTIDNDLYGTDYTIGYATAVNTVVEALDKIRDTASSHNRLFFVEVMGRDAGFIALATGLSGGAEAILIPDPPTDIDDLVEALKDSYRRKKRSSLVIVAEGDERGGAIEISRMVKSKVPEDLFDIRVTILGHIQRGGAPCCQDRVLASRLGVAAVEALIDDKNAIMVGMKQNKVEYTDLEYAIKHNVTVDPEMIRIAKMLSL